MGVSGERIPPVYRRSVTLSRVYDAPVPEVSGACFAGERLILVGDAEPVVAWADWTADGPGEWSTLDIAGLADAPDAIGQFEAVEHLHADTVVILCEEPALLVAVDLREQLVVGWWHLGVDLKGLAKSWRKDANSHGEGFFFGPDRVFVVKEKKPTAIIEFGTAGQSSVGGVSVGRWRPAPSGELVALASWPLDLDDVSDVCVVDGVVWLLSDKARCVMPLGGEPVALPGGIDKPEGLARTPQGGWLLAVDNEDGRNALHVVDLT